MGNLGQTEMREPNQARQGPSCHYQDKHNKDDNDPQSASGASMQGQQTWS